MINLIEILKIFRTNYTPNEKEFQETWKSFWHKSERLPQSQVLGLNDSLSEKADKKDLENVASGMIFKPEVPTVAALKTTYPNVQTGWAAKVTADGYIYQYDGTVWNNTGLKVFPSDVLTGNDITNVLGSDTNKVVSQDLLTNSLSGFSYHYYNSFLFNSAIQQVHAVVSDGTNHFLIASRDPTKLSIQQDYKEIASIVRDLSIGRINACMSGDIIHIVVSNAYIYESGRNKIDYYQYNISTKTLSLVSSIDTGVDIKECWSVVYHNSAIYAAISYKITYSATNEAGSFDNKKAIVELYRLTNNTLQKVSDIATPHDYWGKGLKGNDGKMYYSLPQTGYFRATLSSDGANLYCTYIGTVVASTAKYLVYTKKSTDGLVWTNDEILSNARSNYANVIHYKGNKIYLSKAYTDHTFSYNQSDIIFGLNGRFNLGYFSLVPIISDNGTPINENFNVYDAGDNILISFSYKFADGRDNSASRIIMLSKEDIYNKLKGELLKDRGLFTSLPENPKIGDSYIIDKQTKTNVPVFTFPYSLSTRTEYLNVVKGEKVRVTYNGSKLGWMTTTLQTANDRIDSIVFEHNAQFNPFFSAHFRIPNLTDSADGSILFATSDIRYLSGGDVDIIEVGFARSFDNGQTWQDYTRIFYRNDNANYLNRVHDGTLCVDRNPKSKHYGRIWAFAKMIDTELPEEEWENTGFMTFLSCYSDDNGLTWSNQKVMNGLFPADAYHISTGVAAGITLANGTLVQPTYFTRKENGVKVQRASFIYSTDSETWQAGDITGGYAGENTIIQLPDGKLLMNARDAFSSAWATRRVYTLDAIGSGWVSRPEYETLRTVNCQESLAYNRGTYLFSQPTGYTDGTGRNRITIFKSKDLIKWEKFAEVTNAPSRGYSTLIFRDNRLGILFEGVNPYDIIYSNFDYLLPFIY